jgi:hypothetical protein
MMKTVEQAPKKQDSVIAEIQRIKQQRAQRFGGDAKAMALDLQAQEKGDSRFVSLNPSAGK